LELDINGMGLPHVSHGDHRRLVTHTAVQCAAAQLIFAALVGFGSGPLSLPILLHVLWNRYLTPEAGADATPTLDTSTINAHDPRVIVSSTGSNGKVKHFAAEGV
jgi:hypothetical protein